LTQQIAEKLKLKEKFVDVQITNTTTTMTKIAMITKKIRSQYLKLDIEDLMFLESL